MNEIVRVSGIRHVFDDGTEVNIKGINFTAVQGEKIAVLGHNGSGKSTLLNTILGIISPVEGEVSVFGVNPRKEYSKVWYKIGAVFQNVDEQIIGPTVWDDTAFSMRNYGYKANQVNDAVDNILKEIGIYHLKDKIPHYLSGGEKKKTALAGALVMKPQLLILDEPLDGLDPQSRTHILNLLINKNKEFNMTVIITTHDLSTAHYIADTIYTLKGGKLITKDRIHGLIQQR